MSKRILIIDDEEDVRKYLSFILEKNGYQTATAIDGREGLELARRDKPDLVVLDIVLGKYDGLDLLQDVRNAYYDLPVILCTGYPTFRHDLKSIAAEHCVTKSSDLSELKAKIMGSIPILSLWPRGISCAPSALKPSWHLPGIPGPWRCTCWNLVP